MSISVFARADVSGAPGSGGGGGGGDTPEKWYPGHYWKLHPGDMMSGPTTPNTSKLNTIFQEIRTSPGCRGIKAVIDWGPTENGNWVLINELCKRLYALRQEATPKYARLMLAINLKGSTDITDLLPTDMIVTGGFTPTRPGYTAYTLAYPYTSAGAADNTGTFSGYYPKIWKTTVQTRLAAFMQTLAAHVPPDGDGKSLDEGDLLAMVSTLESAPRNSYNGYQDSTTSDGDPVGSLGAFEDGLWAFAQSMKTAFVHTPVTMSLNYSRSYIAEIIPQLAAKKIGINTPNGNFASGLVAATGNKGILKYFEDEAIASSIILNPECQGDDFMSSMGIDARDDVFDTRVETPVDIPGFDFPSYSTLFNRYRNDLNAHYMVWQRETPFWLGGNFSFNLKTTDPSYVAGQNPRTWPSPPNPMSSFLNGFFKTNSVINNPSDPAGGMRSQKPTNWL